MWYYLNISKNRSVITGNPGPLLFSLLITTIGSSLTGQREKTKSVTATIIPAWLDETREQADQGIDLMPQDVFWKTHSLLMGCKVYFFLRSVTMKMPVNLKVIPSNMISFFVFFPQIPSLPKLVPQRPISVSILDLSEKYAGGHWTRLDSPVA